MRRRNTVTSHECAVRQRNAIAVLYKGPRETSFHRKILDALYNDHVVTGRFIAVIL